MSKILEGDVAAMPTGLKTAIVYDFDGTLAPGNMQEHGILAKLLTTPQEFWSNVRQQKQEHDADQILVYMQLILKKSRDAGLMVTRDELKASGATVPLYKGVEAWFPRINDHASAMGLDLEHYVISSGNEEILEGTKIFHEFKKVFACRYRYDADGNAEWPAVAINYTTKTQFLFRINKGIENSWDASLVNRWIPLGERAIPFSRMIFIGDGDTDIPSMKMTRHQGGQSIAVFDPESWHKEAHQTKVYNLISEDRANFVAPANYENGSQLDITVKGILGRIARDHAGFRA